MSRSKAPVALVGMPVNGAGMATRGLHHRAPLSASVRQSQTVSS